MKSRCENKIFGLLFHLKKIHWTIIFSKIAFENLRGNTCTDNQTYNIQTYYNIHTTLHICDIYITKIHSTQWNHKNRCICSIHCNPLHQPVVILLYALSIEHSVLYKYCSPLMHNSIYLMQMSQKPDVLQIVLYVIRKRLYFIYSSSHWCVQQWNGFSYSMCETERKRNEKKEAKLLWK